MLTRCDEINMKKISILAISIISIILINLSGCSPKTQRLSYPGHKRRKVTRDVIPDIKLSASLPKKTSITLKWIIPNEIKKQVEEINIYRSVENPGNTPLDPVLYSISTYKVENPGTAGSFNDNFFADGTGYYYILEIRLKKGKKIYSNTASIKIPAKKLPTLDSPEIHIDKLNYILEVKDNGVPVKKYPVSLGRNPVKRKLNQDNSSTPEGIYKIINLQPRATYYKAYDINYPNDLDKTRYDFAVEENLIPKSMGKVPPIGGEIQIHGGYDRVGMNWTAGCIAMRNDDIDELFSNKKIKKGIPVIITGSELTKKDFESIKQKRSQNEMETIQRKLKQEGFNPGTIDGRMGLNTMKALGKFQKKNGLPVTMQLDERTAKKLEMTELKEN